MNSVIIVLMVTLALAQAGPANHIQTYVVRARTLVPKIEEPLPKPFQVVDRFIHRTYQAPVPKIEKPLPKPVQVVDWSIHRTPVPINPEVPTYHGIATDSAAEVLANSPFTCNGLFNGHFADVFYNCDYFHHCEFFEKQDGRLYVQQAVFKCGEGTKFNQTLRTCDYADKVICDAHTVENIVEWQLAHPLPSTGPVSGPLIPHTNFKCYADQHLQGYYYADMETTCHVYQRCVYHKAEEILYATQYSFLCPEGTAFDQKTISCQATDTFDCSASPEYYNAQADLHPRYEEF